MFGGEDILATRLEGLRQALQLTDRVVTGNSEVKLVFNKAYGAKEPASSGGSKITVNLLFVKEPASAAGLVHILGLNYHEVAHVRYGVNRATLHARFTVTGKVAHSRFYEAYEIIEEHRVETLLAAKYAKVKKYFTFPVVQHFVKNQAAWPTAFLYTHGRRYLPRKVRDSFQKIFKETYGAKAVDGLSELIDKYRVLSFATVPGQIEGARLINEFAVLLDSHRIPRKPTLHTSEGAGERKPTLSLRDVEEDAEKAKEDTEKQDRKEEQGEDGSEFDDDRQDPQGSDGDEEDDEDEDGTEEPGTGDLADADADKDGGSEDAGGASPEDEAGEEGESEGSGDGEDSEEEDDEPGDGAASGDASDGDGGQVPGPEDGKAGNEEVPEGGAVGSSSGVEASGVGRGEGKKPDPKKFQAADNHELREELAEIADQVLVNPQVRQELGQLYDAMEDTAALASILERHDDDLYDDLAPVTVQMFAEADSLADALRQMWAQMEPGWEYGMSEGNRLDMNRAAGVQSVDDYDHIYDDWREGQQDNAGCEIVIMFDRSSSMRAQAPCGDAGGTDTRDSIASKNLWELKYATQEIEAHVTVLTFDYTCKTLYSREDRVSSNGYVRIVGTGGTNPVPALREARRILSVTEMPNKLLFCLTDGEWGQADACKVILDQIDAVKAAALIGEEDYTFSAQKSFDVVSRTKGNIFDIMAQAVVEIIERNMQK